VRDVVGGERPSPADQRGAALRAPIGDVPRAFDAAPLASRAGATAVLAEQKRRVERFKE
jgi:hypothetical protein